MHSDSTPNRTTSRQSPIIWTAILLIAAAARLYHLQTPSLWFDEGWSAHAASQPSLQAAAAADATNPPLYYTVLHAAARGFGTSELALRWVSALFGLLIIPLSYRLTRRLFDTQLGQRAGVYAGLLAATTPLLWWASQEARMYTLLAVLVLVAATAWHTLIKRPSRGAWLALWLA
ncbi:MAG: hypothetical protein GYB67_12805, partial [Chloroflexi bacterium]|nr:hypothetical protein [Chloroflexota bacterium]